MGKRNSCHPATVEWLGHFRVNSSLCFKARLSAKQMIWNMIFYSDEGETHYHKKVLLSWWAALWDSCPTEQEFLVNYCSFSRLITKYYNSRQLGLLQFTIAWLLQFSTTVITIYDDYYYNSRQNKLQVTRAYAVQVWLVGKWEYQKPQKDTNLGRSCTYSFIWSLKDT